MRMRNICVKNAVYDKKPTNKNYTNEKYTGKIYI